MKLKEITFGTEVKTAEEVVTEVDKALRSDKTQSFTTTQKEQLWANLGLENVTNRSF